MHSLFWWLTIWLDAFWWQNNLARQWQSFWCMPLQAIKPHSIRPRHVGCGCKTHWQPVHANTMASWYWLYTSLLVACPHRRRCQAKAMCASRQRLTVRTVLILGLTSKRFKCGPAKEAASSGGIRFLTMADNVNSRTRLAGISHCSPRPLNTPRLIWAD